MIVKMSTSYGIPIEDSFQECYIQVHNLNAEEQHIEGLIYVVCKRTLIKLGKKQRRIRENEISMGNMEPFDIVDTSLPIHNELDSELTELISRTYLSERSIKILYLRYFCDFSLQKIGNYVGCCRENVRIELKKIHKLLKETHQNDQSRSKRT